MSDDNTVDSLYEIELTIGNKSTKIIASSVVKGGEISTLYFDISSVDKRELMDNMKLSIRPLTQDAQSCTVWLYELSGYSSDYTDEELALKIEEQKNKLLGIQNEEESSGKRIFLSILGLALIMTTVGVGLFMIFGRDASDKDTEK